MDISRIYKVCKAFYHAENQEKSPTSYFMDFNKLINKLLLFSSNVKDQHSTAPIGAKGYYEFSHWSSIRIWDLILRFLPYKYLAACFSLIYFLLFSHISLAQLPLPTCFICHMFCTYPNYPLIWIQSANLLEVLTALSYFFMIIAYFRMNMNHEVSIF